MIKLFNKKFSIILICMLCIGCNCEASQQSNEIIETTESNVLEITSEQNDNDINKNITINFVGDVYFSKHMKGSYDEKGIDGIIDKNYKEILMKSDLNVANLECAITDEKIEANESKQYTLSTPKKYIEALKEIKLNTFTIANNHILDCGEDVFLDMLTYMDEKRINYFGGGKNEKEASKPFVYKKNDKTIAFVGVSSVLPKDNWKANDEKLGVYNGYDEAKVSLFIEELKAKYDKVIVYVHWGNELENASNKNQQRFAHRLIDYGADLIIGSHPHVIQEIEYYKNVPIVYSLGNFIYGAVKKDTMILQTTIDYEDDIDGKIKLKVYPGLSNYEQVKWYWKKDEMQYQLNYLQSKCTTCDIDEEGNVMSHDDIEKMKELEELEALENLINEEK